MTRPVIAAFEAAQAAKDERDEQERFSREAEEEKRRQQEKLEAERENRYSHFLKEIEGMFDVLYYDNPKSRSLLAELLTTRGFFDIYRWAKTEPMPYGGGTQALYHFSLRVELLPESGKFNLVAKRWAGDLRSCTPTNLPDRGFTEGIQPLVNPKVLANALFALQENKGKPLDSQQLEELQKALAT
jgi:hypothetical protein